MRRSLGTLLTAALLSACTGSAESPPEDPAPDPMTPVEPAWSVDLKPIAQPDVVGEVVVLIVKARKRELDIVGLAGATGEELWRHPWSPSQVPNGYSLSPAVVTGEDGEEYVVFQRPGTGLAKDSSWQAPVVVVDPATGEVVGRTAPITLTDPLSECADEVDACARRGSDGDDVSRTVRISVPSAEVRLDEALPAGAFKIGPAGFYARYDDRGASHVGRVADGEVLWEVLGSTVFPAGRHPGAGWSFHHDEDADVIFGSIGMDPPDELGSRFAEGEPVSYEIGAFRAMVGIDAETGESLWASPGASPYCAGPVGGTDHPVRCWWRGTITEQQGKDARYDDLEVTFEGIDPATGEVRWAQVVRGKPAERAYTSNREVFTADGRVLTIDGERVALSFADGSLRPVGPEERFLCDAGEVDFRYAIHWDGRPSRSGGTLRAVCDRDGKAARGPLPRGVVDEAASEGEDGWRFVAFKGEVRGYQL